MKNTAIENRIKAVAKKLFFAYGLRSVTMDDLARESGFSKKTIYAYYDDKQELVQCIVDELLLSLACLFKIVRQEAENAVEEVVKQDAAFVQMAGTVPTNFFSDLEKFFPDVWIAVQRHKQKFFEGILANLKKGKAEGHYRDEIDIAFAADLRLQQLAGLLQPQPARQNGATRYPAISRFTTFFLQAITTEKGRIAMTNAVNEKEANVLATYNKQPASIY